MMRAVVRRVSIFLLVLMASVAAAQQAPRTPPQQTEEKAPTLAPNTALTAEEAAARVKTPVGVAAMPTAAAVDPKSFVLGAEDIIAIRVWREQELSFAAQIRPDGKITMQLVGEIQAAGLTPDQLKASIVEKLGEYINKPEVSVSVQSVQSKAYYITGEVGRSGKFPLVVPIKVLEALTNAGGFREFANTKKIVVMRGEKRIKFNYRDVIKGKNLDQNIYLENGDHIVVQ
ncbi:MAG: polysaccharide biosynthesis/export family protein [Bryobacteraceae bacterium]|nr:polysaccharide biosynthesis/export family protein [Bryobacteraceae bacterium]